MIRASSPVAAMLVAGLLLAGCQSASTQTAERTHSHHGAASDTGPQAPAVATGADVGAALLADVTDARQAIAQGALLAADNDLQRGLADSRQMAGAGSALFPDGASAGSSTHGRHTPTAAAPLSRFAVEVRLQTAVTQMKDGDVSGADQNLQTIEAAVPASALPAAWPLLRAQESLDGAKSAIAGNEPSALPVQLATAEQALSAYAGADHRGDAQALAAEIAQALAAPGGASSIPPERLTDWATRVSGWI